MISHLILRLFENLKKRVFRRYQCMVVPFTPVIETWDVLKVVGIVPFRASGYSLDYVAIGGHD